MKNQGCWTLDYVWVPHITEDFMGFTIGKLWKTIEKLKNHTKTHREMMENEGLPSGKLTQLWTITIFHRKKQCNYMAMLNSYVSHE